MLDYSFDISVIAIEEQHYMLMLMHSLLLYPINERYDSRVDNADANDDNLTRSSGTPEIFFFQRRKETTKS